MDGPRIGDPHLLSDGTRVHHVRIRDVLNPKVKRPRADDPMREEYDAALRITLHLCMIFSGIFTVTLLTLLSVDVYFTIAMEGLIPGAIQEVGDFRFHL